VNQNINFLTFWHEFIRIHNAHALIERKKNSREVILNCSSSVAAENKKFTGRAQTEKMD